MIQKLVDPIPCFIPIWTNAISYAKINGIAQENIARTIQEKFNRRYSSSTCCLVGEAHEQLGKGTEDDYASYGNKKFCQVCDTLSMIGAEKAMFKGGDTLIKFKIKLYNHMVTEHKFKGNIIDLDKVPKVGKC